MSCAPSAPGFMQICIFLCQFTVNCLSCWGKSGKSGYKPEHKPIILSAPALFAGTGLPRMLCQGEIHDAGAGERPLRRRGCSGRGLLAHVMGGVGETPGWGIISSLHIPLRLLLGFVLARPLCTRMFCIHVLADFTTLQLPPAPRC